MAKFWLDTEFHEYSKQPKVLGIPVGEAIDTIELISIGIVSEDYKYAEAVCGGNPNNPNKPIDKFKSKEYYAICKDFDLKAAWNNEWLRENVIYNIWEELRVEDYKEPKSSGRCMIIQTGTYGRKMLIKALLQDSWFTLKDFKRLINKYGKTKKQIAEEIIEFTSKNIKVKYKEFKDDRPNELISAIEKPIEFYAYYADYDWVAFCWLFGRMIDLPKGFPMYCRDLKQELDNKVKYINSGIKIPNGIGSEALETTLNRVKKLPKYPKQTNEHNALDNAKWNKELYKFLKSL